MELERPDRLSQCTWRSNATNTPHTIRKEYVHIFLFIKVIKIHLKFCI